MDMLVLTAGEAEAIRGETSPGHVLNPIVLTDGRYVLPLAVLDDPSHSQAWPYLAAHSTVEDIAADLFPVRVSKRPK